MALSCYLDLLNDEIQEGLSVPDFDHGPAMHRHKGRDVVEMSSRLRLNLGNSGRLPAGLSK